MPELYFTGDDIIALLDPGTWDVVTNMAAPRSATDPDGRTVTTHDTVLRARQTANDAKRGRNGHGRAGFAARDGQTARRMIPAISSALKARSVLLRMLPADPTRSRAATPRFPRPGSRQCRRCRTRRPSTAVPGPCRRSFRRAWRSPPNALRGVAEVLDALLGPVDQGHVGRHAGAPFAAGMCALLLFPAVGQPSRCPRRAPRSDWMGRSGGTGC